ncbi:hypothetical protein EVAR_2498_1 [Eumeta japonica]|uniref:Uncharacterized protein n=1 Tax=Eumeta variegata TaxID=151549 RepID=A0A4C1SRV6_EUMVA|nr:hypothetical protein EVAR_2498_1 [Eumeta japonica]
MSHRTRERPAECLASLSHSTMIGLPRARSTRELVHSLQMYCKLFRLYTARRRGASYTGLFRHNGCRIKESRLVKRKNAISLPRVCRDNSATAITMFVVQRITEPFFFLVSTIEALARGVGVVGAHSSLSSRRAPTYPVTLPRFRRTRNERR